MERAAGPIDGRDHAAVRFGLMDADGEAFEAAAVEVGAVRVEAVGAPQAV